MANLVHVDIEAIEFMEDNGWITLHGGGGRITFFNEETEQEITTIGELDNEIFKHKEPHEITVRQFAFLYKPNSARLLKPM